MEYSNMSNEEILAMLDKRDRHIAMLEDILDASTKPSAEVKPEVKGTIALKDLWAILRKETKTVNIFISDNLFNTTSVEECTKFLENFNAHYTYSTDTFDCDNFSVALKHYWNGPTTSYPLGIAWSANHAFNIFVDNENQVWVIEPQTKKVFKWGESKEFSKTELYEPIKFILI